MPGLFGVVDLQRGRGGRDLHALACEVARRLTRQPNYRCDLHRTQCAVFGRIGASFHHNTPWPAEAGQPAVAGILHDPLQTMAHLAARRFSEASGFFAAACADGQGLTVAVDRRASIPIFFCLQDGLLVFAPEVKGVLAAPGLSREPDPAAIASFMASGHLIGDQTLFRAVRRLRGGQALTVDRSGSASVASYWRFRPGARAGGLSEEALREELAGRVEAAVARNLKEPDRTAILLSGGADSRGMLCAAMKLLPPERINAVTWAGEEGGTRSDLDIARAVTAQTGIRHHLLRTTVETYATDFRRSAAIIDGLSDMSPFHPQYYRLAARIAEMGFPIVLRGDEVFGWWHPVASLQEAMVAVGLRSPEQAGAASLLQPDLQCSLNEAWSRKIAELVGELGGLTPGQAKDVLYFDHRLQGYLNTGAMLRQVHLDHRNPLLDETLFDFMELVPDHLRHHKLLFQQAMAQRYPKLWRVGIAGAVNTEDWRSIYARDPEIRRFLKEEFTDSGSGLWEYLDPSQAHRLIDAVTRQQAAPGALQARMKSALRSALEFVPSNLMKLVSRPPNRPPTGPARLIMRVLALKYWFDALQRA